jgi:hypothetical protein
MLNLEESLDELVFYNQQRDLLFKTLSYSLGVFIFVELIRNLVSEINLLQLVPGFYLLFLFFSLVLVIIFSELLNRLPIEIDIQKSFGTKTNKKAQFFLFSKFAFLCIFGIISFLFTSIIPLSLDSFNSYGEKTIESIWSFAEVVNLEILFFFVLLIIVQFPFVGISSWTNEKTTVALLKLFKLVSFFIFLFSGVLTPTIDGYTQLSFSFFSILLYGFLMNILEKRILVKFSDLLGLNS